MKWGPWTRRRLWVPVAVGGVLMLGLWFRAARAPRYEGRPASYWVDQLLRDQVGARKALRAIGPASVPALAHAVNRRRSRVRTWLESWRPKFPSFLARRLPNPALDQLLEERAIELLYDFGPEAAPAVPALLEVSASLDDAIGFGSAGLAHAALIQVGPAGLPYFIRALEHGTGKTRASAASFIGRLEGQAGPASTALARALNDPSAVVRGNAVTALGQIGPPARAALPALRSALGRDDDSFRLQGIRALWRIGHETEETLPILVRMLCDRANPNRAGAAMLLGEMGPAAAPAAPALAEVLQEEFSYTRVKAEEALRQIAATRDERQKPDDKGRRKSEAF